jgi:hypothetical protein
MTEELVLSVTGEEDTPMNNERQCAVVGAAPHGLAVLNEEGHSGGE